MVKLVVPLSFSHAETNVPDSLGMDGELLLEYTRTGYVWRRPAPADLVPGDPEFPQTQLAEVADKLARGAEPDFMYNHSARSYLFARVAAAARGLAADGL